MNRNPPPVDPCGAGRLAYGPWGLFGVIITKHYTVRVQSHTTLSHEIFISSSSCTKMQLDELTDEGEKPQNLNFRACGVDDWS